MLRKCAKSGPALSNRFCRVTAWLSIRHHHPFWRGPARGRPVRWPPDSIAKVRRLVRPSDSLPVATDELASLLLFGERCPRFLARGHAIRLAVRSLRCLVCQVEGSLVAHRLKQHDDAVLWHFGTSFCQSHPPIGECARLSVSQIKGSKRCLSSSTA